MYMDDSSNVRKILKEYIMAVITERRRKGSSPGGPRTDLGALRQLEPNAFATKVRGAMDSAKGDVEAAASQLDVRPRTMYHYLDSTPGLDSIKTSTEREEEREEAKAKKKLSRRIT